MLTEDINIACYILNRALIRSILKNIPDELFKGRKSNIAHFHAFGCQVYMLNNNKDNLEKFNAKSNEGIIDG